MASWCTICREAYDDAAECPRCQGQPKRSSSEADLLGPLPRTWSRNPWVRVVLGVLLAQGLYYAAEQFFLAGVMVIWSDSVSETTSLAAMLSLQGLQIIALLAGSVLAGAGQRNAGLYGSLVGVWNGIIATMATGLSGGPLTVVSLYATPLLHAAVGGLGGLIGARIWRPIGAATPTGTDRPTFRPPRGRSIWSLTHAEFHWLRIFAGVMVSVGGFLWADTILHAVLKSSDGNLSIRSSLQQEVITLEICALGVFLGGVLAGATTWRGGAQGAMVGVFSVLILLAMGMINRQAASVPMFCTMLAGVLILGLLGGAFGGRLLPPISRPRKHRDTSAIPI